MMIYYLILLFNYTLSLLNTISNTYSRIQVWERMGLSTHECEVRFSAVKRLKTWAISNKDEVKQLRWPCKTIRVTVFYKAITFYQKGMLKIHDAAKISKHATFFHLKKTCIISLREA